MNKSPGPGWKFAGRKETFHRAVVDSNVEVTHRDKFKVRRAGVHNFYTNTTVIPIRPRALVPGKYIVAFVEVTSFASFLPILLTLKVTGKRFITREIGSRTKIVRT